MDGSLQSFCFEQMRPDQVRQQRESADIGFLPLGSLEWHGVHNPLGTDALKAWHICCLAAKELGGGAVFPPLVWGVPRDSFYVGTNSSLGDIYDQSAEVLGTEPERIRNFAPHGGMDVQEQWLFFQRLLRMSLEQIAGFGFQSIYICSGHNPLITWARPVAEAFMRASSMVGHIVTVACGNEYDAAGLCGDHGGQWETSLMMAYDSTLVDLELIKHDSRYRGVGSHSDAVEASKEQGKAWANACAIAIAAEVRTLLRA